MGIIARVLSFDDKKREVPHYKAEAPSTDKGVGLKMVQYLKNLFSITRNDEQGFYFSELREQSRIKWTRDSRGNIISPWRKKQLEKQSEKENNQ